MRKIRWRWRICLVLGVLLYALLGQARVVPWVDFLSYEQHLALGEQEMKTGHFARAEWHFQAAVKKAWHFPANDPRRGDSWMALGKACLWADGLLIRMPKEKELRTQLGRALRGAELQRAFGYTAYLKQRRRLARASAKIVPVYNAALTDYAHVYGKQDARYLQCLADIIEILDANGKDKLTFTFYVKKYRVQSRMLPAGDPAIIETLQLMGDAASNRHSTGELAALYQEEIERCEHQGHPSTGLITLYEWRAQSAHAMGNPTEALALYAHCAQLAAAIFKEGTATQGSINAGRWIGYFIEQGRISKASEITDQLVAAARRTKGTPTAGLANLTLYDCALAWSGQNSVQSQFIEQRLSAILSAQLTVDPHDFSTGEVWAMLGNLYLEQKQYNRAEQCYAKAIAIIDRAWGRDTTAAMYQGQMPPDSERVIYIWHIYGGYCNLLRTTGRAHIAAKFEPLLD